MSNMLVACIGPFSGLLESEPILQERDYLRHNILTSGWWLSHAGSRNLLNMDIINA